MVDTVVVIKCTIFTAETKGALASVVITAVQASGTIFARIEFFGAELDLLFAVRP